MEKTEPPSGSNFPSEDVPRNPWRYPPGITAPVPSMNRAPCAPFDRERSFWGRKLGDQVTEGEVWARNFLLAYQPLS